MIIWQVDYWDYMNKDVYFQIKAKDWDKARKRAKAIVLSKLEKKSYFTLENLTIIQIRGNIII